MVFTFYSYKGGVGRSMALANVAEFFYRAGLNVLMVDWDLEAPGLERFFLNGNEILDKRGVIDLLLEYQRVLIAESSRIESTKLSVDKLDQPLEFAVPALENSDALGLNEPLESKPSEELEREEFPFEKPDRLVVNVYEGATSPSQLWLLTAGRRSEGNFQAYARSVINFDWGGFYRNWEGEIYFEWLRRQFNEIADIVLIDSRTGITEMGGVCTYHLADVIVMLLAPTEQSLHGSFKMAEKFKSPDLQKARGGRPIELVIAPSRLEFRDASVESIDRFRNRITDYDLDSFLAKSVKEGGDQIIDLRINYMSAFAFTEAVAMHKTSLHAEEMSEDYKKIAIAMTKAALDLPTTSLNGGLRERLKKLIDVTELKAIDLVAKYITRIHQELDNKSFDKVETDWSQLLRRIDSRIDEEVYPLIVEARQKSLDAIGLGLNQLIADYEQSVRQGIESLKEFVPVTSNDGQWQIKENQLIALSDAPEIEAWQALTKLKDTARNHARYLAEQKKKIAEKLLHTNPLEAEQVLEEALRLYWLQPNTREEIQNYQQTILAPRKEQYLEARSLLDEAEQQTGFQQWRRLQKVFESNPYIPDLAETREKLRPRYEQWVQQELSRLRHEQATILYADLGQDQYQKQYRGLISQANELTNWNNLSQRLVSEIKAFVNRSREVLQTHADVSGQTRAIQGYIEQRNFRLANEVLARLQERIGETQLRDYYPDLPGIQTQLDMRNRIDALVKNLQTDLGADDSSLEQSIYTLQSALKDAPDHPDIPPLLRRLRSRLAFRQGQKAYEEERYIEARRELEKVDSDDKIEAQSLLRQLEAAEKERDELARDIDRISKAREAKQWRSAYELARRWIGQPVHAHSLETRLAQLHKDIVEEWHTDATRNLETLSRQRPLNEARIKEYLRVFDILNAHKELAEWQRKALAPCHQQAAQIAQQKGDMEESVRQWREALRLDGDNDAYEEGLAQARKALLARQIAAAPADWEAAVRLYRELQQEYPEDVEIRLRLAEIYLHQQKLGAASSELAWIDALARQKDVSLDASIIAEKDRLREQIEQAQTILQRREEIKAYLQISRDVNDYEDAQRLYQELLQDYPGANADNREWWEKSLARLAGELEKDWQQAVSDAEGPQATGQVVVILRKILTLQPGNTKAKQQLLRVANQAGDLGNEVDRFIGAPLGRATAGATPLAALENRIEQAQDLQEQVATCLEALSSQLADEVVDSKQKYEQLQERQIDLLRHIQTLGTLRDLLQQGYVRLEKGQRSGQWAEVETITNRLQQEFGDHPVVYAFMRELEQTKRTRQEVDRKSEALKRAVQAEQWRESQRLLAELRELDGDGRYLVMDSLTFKTDFAERPLSFSELENRLTDHLSRLIALYQWLAPLLQAAPWRGPALPIANLLPNDLRSLTQLLAEWLNTPEDKSLTVGRFILFTIREQRDRGDFGAALALCQDALGNDTQNKMTTVGFSGRYTLRYLYGRLQQAPEVPATGVDGELMTLATQQGQLCQSRIATWLAQAEQELTDLNRQETLFKQMLADLRGCVGRQSGAWLWQKGQIREQGNLLYRQLREISPQAVEPQTLYGLLTGA